MSHARRRCRAVAYSLSPPEGLLRGGRAAGSNGRDGLRRLAAPFLLGDEPFFPVFFSGRFFCFFIIYPFWGEAVAADKGCRA